MLADEVYSLYRMKLDQTISLHHHKGFVSGGHVFIMVPLHQHCHKELNVLAQMAEHLRMSGEYGVGQPVKNQSGNYLSELDHQKIVLYHCQDVMQLNRSDLPAKELAEFHLRGSQYRFLSSVSHRYETWTEVWSKRIDQLESWRNTLMKRKPLDKFDERFISTFPYYLGLAENAIQYAVDSLLESRFVDQRTICHHRFNPYSWDVGGVGPLKLPSDWVVDYPVRDLAEWIRFHVWITEETNPSLNFSILEIYQSYNPLTPTAMRLLYSRLLFPVAYIEIIEGYYLSYSEKQREGFSDRLEKTVKKSTDQESFLKAFQENQSNNLPQVDWLN